MFAALSGSVSRAPPSSPPVSTPEIRTPSPQIASERRSSLSWKPSLSPPPQSYVPTVSPSITSSISAALSGLSPRDVELIDEIIERSPPSATTFLTVFKAYNEVLQERGIDAANDVVYYKILLKLGVVKGKDWGTKWRTVKAQQGYGYSSTDDDNDEKDEEEVELELEGDSTPRHKRLAALRPVDDTRTQRVRNNDVLPPFHRHRTGVPRPNATKPPLSLYGADSVTVHSHHEDDSELPGTATETETETGLETETGTNVTDDQDAEFSSSPTTLIQRERASDTKENALRLTTEPMSYPPLPTVDQFLPVHARKLHSKFPGTSEFSSDIITRTSSPPPPRQKVPTTRKPLQPLLQANIPVPSPQPRPIKRATKLTSRNESIVSSHNETSIDDEDTWRKLKMIRDEKEADKFREVMLLERCWEVWKGGLRWLIVSDTIRLVKPLFIRFSF